MAGIGTQYMVIDLGGGTADISVHEKNDDGTLKEIHKASGGPWGGVYVDDNYLKFLEHILGEKVITELRTKEMIDFFDLIREFETKQRSFKSTSTDKVMFRISASTRSLCKKFTGQEFEERLAASKYCDSVIVNGGDKLRVEPDIVKDWFDGPINNLVDHLKSLLEEPWLEAMQTIVLAGLDGTRVQLALEPEAASIWCEALDVDIQHKLAGIGTQYMVIDLGGGTADISVHEKNDDGTLKEIHKASGGPWGGIYVDDNYLKFLEHILGEKVITELRTKEMTDFFDLIREFETKKRSFKSTSKDKVMFRICASTRSFCKQITGQEFEERLAASKYCDSVIVNGGDKLRVEPDIVKDWFDGPINNLVDHLKSILKEPKLKAVQTIVLVAYKTTSPIYRTTVENPVYVTEHGCELLGTLVTELPRDIPLSELDHDITFMFGGTELVVKVRVRKTGQEEILKLNCLK
ncbi:HS12A-like protein [Mya arenaria]|uniref:HS12A-like protein n=1 Tax=Mya arenaria TaxID=6604 RepID=A0ABY7G592_MYAAR|nr:HS12A-like protein [Mya arenaria]